MLGKSFLGSCLIPTDAESPGRFLAVTELKLMVANILLNYDLKIVDGTKPKAFYFGTAKVPDLGYRILMKTRNAE